MSIKVIKNDQEYQEALQLVSELMDADPEENTPESEKLELLIVLVRNYEESVFNEVIPDPIDALIFRMEQENLSQEDLVPYIGSRSKVSEVLSRKRPLSVNMMKALQNGLGIPAKVLLNQSRKPDKKKADFSKLPIKEMKKRGYIPFTGNIEEEVTRFFNVFNGQSDIFALPSRSHYLRSNKPMNPQSFYAWVARLLNRVEEIADKPVFEHSKLNKKVMREVIDLSDEKDGIHKAINFLKEIGIFVLIEPHMPKTYLDGAAVMYPDKNPIIGLTVRYDRLDNFWFTLMHELAHIYLHYDQGISVFYDDTELFDAENEKEKEADETAMGVMIPGEVWVDSAASLVPSPDAAKILAQELSISPAIVAGKMRRERKHYQFLNSLLGRGQVRNQFENVDWK